MIFGGDRFLIFFFCTKVFLRPRRSVLLSFSTVLRLEVEEKGEERTIVLIHSAAPLRLLYLRRNRHTCQTTRESRVAVAHVVTLYVVVQSWLIDKQAKKMQPAQVVVGEAVITWPGVGRCGHTIADVDEPSKKTSAVHLRCPFRRPTPPFR